MKTILPNGKDCISREHESTFGPLIAIPLFELKQIASILETLVDGQQDADPFYEVEFKAKFDLDYFYGIKHDLDRRIKSAKTEINGEDENLERSLDDNKKELSREEEEDQYHG
jgi:hypothetical protein